MEEHAQNLLKLCNDGSNIMDREPDEPQNLKKLGGGALKHNGNNRL